MEANFLLKLIYPSLQSNTKMKTLPTLCIMGKLDRMYFTYRTFFLQIKFLRGWLKNFHSLTCYPSSQKLLLFTSEMNKEIFYFIWEVHWPSFRFHCIYYVQHCGNSRQSNETYFRKIEQLPFTQILSHGLFVNFVTNKHRFCYSTHRFDYLCFSTSLV